MEDDGRFRAQATAALQLGSLCPLKCQSAAANISAELYSILDFSRILAHRSRRLLHRWQEPPRVYKHKICSFGNTPLSSLRTPDANGLMQTVVVRGQGGWEGDDDKDNGLASRASSDSPGTVPPAALHTAKITGAYIAAIGICLVVAPTTLFGLVFDVAELQRLWIRVFGSLCALLGWYYFGAARDGSRGFLEATVSGRFVLALLLLAIVASEGVHLPDTGESFASWFRSSHMGLVLLAATMLGQSRHPFGAGLNGNSDLQRWDAGSSAILSRRPFLACMDAVPSKIRQKASMQSCSLPMRGLRKPWHPALCLGVLILGFQLLSWAFVQPSSVRTGRRRPRHVLRRSQGEEADPVDTVEADADEEGEVLYFGGVSQEREEPEETEAMQIAGRINQALAMRRLPLARLEEAPIAPVETGWYEELDVLPNATTEEIRLKYLEIAEDVEERLGYLLEEGRGGSYEEQLLTRDDEEDDEWNWARWEEGNNESGITLQPESSLMEAPPENPESPEEEAEILAQEFYRVSNLYQILSVPQLRKIYDEGGVEGLAMKVPALRKGLLEPERVLKMAQGIKTPTKQRESLLLRQEPREKTFRRYMGKNSIRQVLRRITDCLRVWCFKSKESLKFRKNTIYEELPEIAVFGRVNSGKSAMLQHLFSATNPRRNGHFSVAQTPGKTKGVQVYCLNRRFTIADMPGYGKNDRRHEVAQEVHNKWDSQWKPLVEEYLNTTHWLRAAIYVHDIAKDVTGEDLETLNMLKKHGIPTLLVFTKDDKVDSETHRQSRTRYLRQRIEEPESDVEDLLRPDLGFDPLTVFRESYAQACGLMEKVLEVPPLGEQFTAAVTGLHAIGNILDRLFQAWATDDLGRLSQMREDSEGFAKSFGGRDNPLQSLLAHAGFERRDMDGTSGKPGAVWVLDHTNPSLRLRALTVRLCLRRFAELQRLRGTHRWAQSSNAAVVPKPDEDWCSGHYVE
eukprot:s3748_g2.t2